MSGAVAADVARLRCGHGPAGQCAHKFHMCIDRSRVRPSTGINYTRELTAAKVAVQF